MNEGINPPVTQSQDETPKSSGSDFVSQSGEVILEAPRPEQVSAINATPRVEYFPHQISPGTAEHYPVPDHDLSQIRQRHRDAGLFFYGLVITKELTEKIKHDFPDDELVGIRGIAVSVGGEVDTGRTKIKSLEQILYEGSELGGAATLVTWLGRDTTDIHKRSVQWPIEAAREFRGDLRGSPKAGDIFPAVIVYDQDKLKPLGGYDVSLPESPEEKAEAILNIYVLDFPNP